MSSGLISAETRGHFSGYEERVIVNAGWLALAAGDLLDDALSDDSRLMLPWMAETDRRTFEHQSRVAAIALDVANVAHLDEEKSQQLVTAAFFHDLGKFDLRMQPLVQFPGDFDEQQRYRMGWHAKIGAHNLSELSLRSWQRNDVDTMGLYAFSSYVARDHHLYNLPYPKPADAWEQWVWEATIIVQNIDRPDALTSKREEREYLAHRMKREGESDPYAIVGNYLRADYGEARTEPLPISGLSPQDIAEIALWDKAHELANT
jgi:hypothetical protein